MPCESTHSSQSIMLQGTLLTTMPTIQRLHLRRSRIRPHNRPHHPSHHGPQQRRPGIHPVPRHGVRLLVPPARGLRRAVLCCRRHFPPPGHCHHQRQKVKDHLSNNHSPLLRHRLPDASVLRGPAVGDIPSLANGKGMGA